MSLIFFFEDNSENTSSSASKIRAEDLLHTEQVCYFLKVINKSSIFFSMSSTVKQHT